MRTIRVIFVLLMLGALVTPSVWADWKTPRQALDQRLVSGEFNIFYTLSGDNAFPSSSSVPNATLANNYAQQFAQKLNNAASYYEGTLGLRHFFSTRRYARATSVDIHIIDLGSSNGSTGDEINSFAYTHFPSSAAAIAVALSTSLQPGSLTPEHELMHVYMNSYTFFKNQWFTEGMARASESFFRTSLAQTSVLPQTSAQLNSLLLKSYDAETLWSRLIDLCSKNVWAVTLENFSRLDRQAALARDLDPTAWPEDEQYSTSNNSYLLKGIAEAVHQSCPTQGSAEIRQFLSVIKSRTSGLVTNRSPGLSDYAGFSAMIAQAGGKSSVQADGRITVDLDGTIYVGWPGWEVNTCKLTGLYNASLKTFGYGNGKVCQPIYAASADLTAVQAVIASLDPLGELQFEDNGQLKISFSGSHITLIPDYTLSNLSATNAGNSFWIESEGRVMLAYPALNMAQAFTSP